MIDLAREQRLAQVFVEVASTLLDDYDVLDLLQRLATRSVELLGVSAAGIMLADANEELQIMAASDEHARLLDLLALQHDRGPCAECYRSGEAGPNIDLTAPESLTRWPGFTERALATGYVTTHAIPLRLRKRVVGALNLFQSADRPLREEDLALAQAFADVATLAILQQHTLERGHLENTQLQAALDSRVVVEQVKGILAERWQTTPDEAFDAFRHHARAQGLHLSELAGRIIDGSFDVSAIPAPEPHAGR
ncbi:GAF and ANTAR domain-containing protein [Streptomyces silaceus]|uniref:GAF and ANTAR domain-containing protein n=1 Tax=Streptomyces silaceus TaxID=545123 RepID=UPI0006EBDD34|nr:GAF and ANTAR domain-containing protein [Streptomyces silaceus]